MELKRVLASWRFGDLNGDKGLGGWGCCCCWGFRDLAGKWRGLEEDGRDEDGLIMFGLESAERNEGGIFLEHYVLRIFHLCLFFLFCFV